MTKTEIHNYEMTDETMEYQGRTLHRIRATKRFKAGWRKVKKGESGGWIESYDNLSGNAWVAEEAKVFDRGRVIGDAIITGHAAVGGNAYVLDNSVVGGFAFVIGDAIVRGRSRVSDWCYLKGNTCLCDVDMYGEVRINGNISISGPARVCTRGGNKE